VVTKSYRRAEGKHKHRIRQFKEANTRACSIVINSLRKMHSLTAYAHYFSQILAVTCKFGVQPNTFGIRITHFSILVNKEQYVRVYQILSAC
jgi:hypothetical protein